MFRRENSTTPDYSIQKFAQRFMGNHFSRLNDGEKAQLRTMIQTQCAESFDAGCNVATVHDLMPVHELQMKPAAFNGTERQWGDKGRQGSKVPAHTPRCSARIDRIAPHAHSADRDEPDGNTDHYRTEQKKRWFNWKR